MAQNNLGKQLARLLRSVPMTAVQVAKATGATRATVYNWLSGRGVSPAYRSNVQKLITKLENQK
jgi:hypothetical protein